MKTAILSLIAFVLYSCGNVTDRPISPVVGHEEDIKKEYAYLFGNFEMSQSAARADKSYMSMAFVLECDDGNNYKIQLTIENPIQLIRVKPAKCSSTKALYIAENGSIYEEKATPIRFLTNLNFKSGNAYYIGDYYAMAFRHVFSKGRRGSWNLKRIEDKYDETTQKLKEIYSISSEIKLNNVVTL